MYCYIPNDDNDDESCLTVLAQYESPVLSYTDYLKLVLHKFFQCLSRG